MQRVDSWNWDKSSVLFSPIQTEITKRNLAANALSTPSFSPFSRRHCPWKEKESVPLSSRRSFSSMFSPMTLVANWNSRRVSIFVEQLTNTGSRYDALNVIGWRNKMHRFEFLFFFLSHEQLIARNIRDEGSMKRDVIIFSTKN